MSALVDEIDGAPRDDQSARAVPLSEALAALPPALASRTSELIETGMALAPRCLGAAARAEAALIVAIALESICRAPDEAPLPALEDGLTLALRRLEAALACQSELTTETSSDRNETTDSSRGKTAELFEEAWTLYDDKTYAEAVELVAARLQRSDIDSRRIAGRDCFDGGAGIGRLSVALARRGARRVVAADLGQRSLDYLAARVAGLGLTTIETQCRDVTDLSDLPPRSFDFVASYGVLHHTPAPTRGLLGHLRLVKPGGALFLYLYGAGGIYWPLYDALRPLVAPLGAVGLKRALAGFGLRQGLIYSLLDNLLAPRRYFGLAETLEIIESEAAVTWRHARGLSAIDDTRQLLASRHGQEIFGPDGEIRLVIEPR